ncbi:MULTISPECIES: SWIM zinc finger family protein [Spirulina sp. CCY15215]|uniref:SWIM zinc finger family protein n=1 Tax=Spirulina sp. CCY15215 TaxID=2767591 RepID=UPI00194E5A40|nr:SWIM zinc finger family protein [Spirulina major]
MFSLSETQIQRLATPNSYDRGQDYYQRHAILQPTRQGNVLSAFCIGTALYHVTIAFDENEISNAQCSCPYRYGGLCKHGVALLLTWCKEPEAFQNVPTLQETLAKRSKVELIELVEAMVTQEPMLLSLINDSLLPTPNSLSWCAFPRRGNLAGVAPLLPRINATLELPTARAIVEALQPFIELARRYFDAGNILDAGSLYCLLLSELTQSYDAERESLDYNGELCALSSVLVTSLRECLVNSNIPKTLQQLWIGALIEAYRRNIDGGEYAYGVEAVLLAIDSEQLEDVVANLDDRQTHNAIFKLLEKKTAFTHKKTIALSDYPAAIEKEINKRHRRYYRQAARYLQEYKAICDEQTWLNYINLLRDRYGSLRSLWKEIEKAELR